MTVPALDDRRDRLYGASFTSTEGDRDRFAFDRRDVLADSLEAWRINPLARRIVELTSQYVVGGGIEVTSHHEQTNDFLHTWQEHRLNRLQVRSFEWCDELTRTGNLFLLLTTDSSGMTFLRAVPAADIADIETRANDVEQPLKFWPVATVDDPTPQPWPAYDQDADDGASPVMLHYAINRPVGAKWGEPDLAPILSWLSRYAAWLQDRARLNKYRQAFMYIVQGNYASAADRLQRQAEINANPPQPGSILVTDTSELWGILNPQLDSFNAAEDGLSLKKMIAAGAGVPLHFLAEPESSTRTTAEAAGGPTYRHYQQRQVFFLWLLRDLARIAVRRRALVDRHVSVKADLDAQAPDISGRDNAALAVATTQIVNAFAQLHDRGLIPDDEFLRLAYAFAGETVDLQDLIARAPGKPQTDFAAPAQPGKPSAAPGAPSAAQGNDAKPYNQNDDGDVSPKGQSMSTADVAALVAAETRYIHERLSALQTATPPAPPAPVTNQLTLDLTPIAQAIAASQQIAADAGAAGLQAVSDALVQLADRQPPAPIVNVAPQINVPAQPQPRVNVTVETPRRTKTVQRDDEGRITQITEQ